jgi:hypothetical protein
LLYWHLGVCKFSRCRSFLTFPAESLSFCILATSAMFLTAEQSMTKMDLFVQLHMPPLLDGLLALGT